MLYFVYFSPEPLLNARIFVLISLTYFSLYITNMAPSWLTLLRSSEIENLPGFFLKRKEAVRSFSRIALQMMYLKQC